MLYELDSNSIPVEKKELKTRKRTKNKKKERIK
jgi:hypothetical protein